MSILIKGMEMPTQCDDGCICFERCNARGLFVPLGWCHIINREIYSTAIPDDCPLVPVPPHGRLGDLDKLALEMMDAANVDQALAMLDDAPTIIPEEEGE